MLTLLSITELKHSSFFCSFLLSTLCIVGFANNCMAVLNALCQRLLDYYTSLIIAFLSSLLLFICAYWRITNTFIHFVHLLPSFMSSSPGSGPQTEKQVEKVSTLSLVRRDTALLLRDFRQGASNWIHSLLDSSRAPASTSTAPEAPTEATGIQVTVIVVSCQVGTLGVAWMYLIGSCSLSMSWSSAPAQICVGVYLPHSVFSLSQLI